MGKKRSREESEERIRKKIKKWEKKLKIKQIINQDSSDEDSIDPGNATDSDAIESSPPDVEPENTSPENAVEPSRSTETTNTDSSAAPVTTTNAVPVSAPVPPPITDSAQAPSTAPVVLEATPGTSKAPEAVEPVLDDEILKILGEAPEPEITFGKAVHKDLATRWQDILKKGLTKEVKEKISKEYPIPSNCELLLPPTLNPEAKAALTETFVKRDASLLNRQKQVSTAVSALAQAIEMLISNDGTQDLKQKVLKPISDACRVLCDMHHKETIIRRKFVISSINTSLKDTLTSSTTDKFLFGDNMADKLKAAKTVQRSGEALKTSQKPKFKNNNFGNKSYANKNQANYKSLHQKTAGKDAGKSQPAPRYQNAKPQTPQQRRNRDSSPAPAQTRRQNHR